MGGAIQDSNIVMVSFNITISIYNRNNVYDIVIYILKYLLFYFQDTGGQTASFPSTAFFRFLVALAVAGGTLFFSFLFIEPSTHPDVVV